MKGASRVFARYKLGITVFHCAPKIYKKKREDFVLKYKLFRGFLKTWGE
jgi:hypothetical protein